MTANRPARREKKRLRACEAAEAAGIPFAGACAFCGCDDSRHRLVDAIRGRRSAGDSREVLSRDYELTDQQVRIVCGEGVPSRK